MTPQTKKIRHKFNAKPSFVGDIRFSSKKERDYYHKLTLAEKSGDLVMFLRQVPIHLPGNVRYVVDFLEFWKDGEVKFTDVKGYETPEFILKKKLVEAHYPIKINIVK